MKLPELLCSSMAILLLACCGQCFAITSLDDNEMSDVSGSGMTFTWDNFRFMAKPTSYLEQVGSNTGGTGNTFQRGDLRWYGLNVSGTDLGTTWTESSGAMVACGSLGVNGLGCPRGGPVSKFAAADNPYILRAFDYAGDSSAATAIGNGIVSFTGDNNAGTSKNVVLELLAPTLQPNYRFSFWGEIEVAKNGATNSGLLKTQTIVLGNASGSVLRLFQFTETSNKTLALFYHSRLKGDFRFSVNQATTTSDVLGTPVIFDPNEGMHFRNVNAFIPLGQLFYQALTLDVPRDGSNNPITDGNFVLELKTTPDVPAVYTRFYSLTDYATGSAQSPSAWEDGYATARAAYLAKVTGNTMAAAGYSVVNANYDTTHGYSRWGDWAPCQGVGCPNPPTTATTAVNALAGVGRNSYNSTGDGVFFQKCSSCANFNAFAYRVVAADVRPYSGTNSRGAGTTTGSATTLGYTTLDYYSVTQDLYDGSSTSATTGCTAGTSGTAMYKCGYGGSFLSTNAQYGSSPISNATNQLDPSNFITRSNAQGLGASTSTIPVVSTGIVNLGDNRVEGLLLNHVKFTSYGAQY